MTLTFSCFIPDKENITADFDPLKKSGLIKFFTYLSTAFKENIT